MRWKDEACFGAGIAGRPFLDGPGNEVGCRSGADGSDLYEVDAGGRMLCRRDRQMCGDCLGGRLIGGILFLGQLDRNPIGLWWFCESIVLIVGMIPLFSIDTKRLLPEGENG